MPERSQVHILVSGVVQGVGFRYFAHRAASALDLAGYVRNLPDGRVEVEAEGDRTALAALVEELKIGPRWSHVAGVRVEWQAATGDFHGFHIR